MGGGLFWDGGSLLSELTRKPWVTPTQTQPLTLGEPDGWGGERGVRVTCKASPICALFPLDPLAKEEEEEEEEMEEQGKE